MTQEQQVSIAGAVTYWTLSERADYEQMKQGFETLGLDRFCPTPPTQLVAVKKALVEVFRKRKHLVRPLHGTRYAVVREEKEGRDDLSYEIVFRVEADDLDNLHFDNPDHPAVPAFEEAYHRIRRNVAAHAVGAALSSVAHHLGGVRLRESGGVFWLPADALDLWTKVSGVIAAASNENATVYRLQTAIDDDAVAAVSDAITRDVEDSITDIRKKLKEQERESSFQKRKNEAVALDARIAKYESILGKTLDTLREKQKAAENEASLAVLAAMGGE